MNKYILRIPYSFRRYGNYSCIVYANSEDEAEQMADDFGSHYSEDYDDDNDSDSDSDFDYSDTQVEIEEEDVESPDSDDNEQNNIEKLPEYFLSEINLI